MNRWSRAVVLETAGDCLGWCSVPVQSSRGVTAGKGAAASRRALFGAVLALLALPGCRSGGHRATALPAPPRAPLAFTDVAGARGIAFDAGISGKSPLNIGELMAGGVGWVDGDGDGWYDLVLVGLHGAALYRNEEGRGFRDATRESGLGGVAGALQGVAAADYDGDGREDLLITRADGVTLLRNESRGPGALRFRDVTRAAGLTVGGWCTSAAFADVDG